MQVHVRKRKRTAAANAPAFIPHGEVACSRPIFSEPMCVLEFMALRLSPVYGGSGVQHGDGSAVVLIPGLLAMDSTLFELRGWLRRIGYRPHYSGIGIGADCPNRLAGQLDETIDRAYEETGRRVHLIGHSLGGIFARSAAVRRPAKIASVITLGSPFRGLVADGLVLAISHAVRGFIHRTRPELPPECASSRCGCAFGRSLGRRWPRSVRQTAFYSKVDGMVNWQYCLTGRPGSDIEVVGTHVGLPFNAKVYSHIAARLAGPRRRAKDGKLSGSGTGIPVV
jgi:triacylglycerol lipase